MKHFQKISDADYLKTLDVVELKAPQFSDIQHADGSKSYQLMTGGYVHIKRASVVKFIDNILSQNFTGWGYVPAVKQAVQNGVITNDEAQQIFRILD